MRAAYLLTALLLLVALAPASQSLGGLSEPRPLIRILDGVFEPMPMHTPVPETNVGIGPGAFLYITIPDEGTFACSANFVWRSATKTYLGSAGHCFMPPDKTATHGPGADFDASRVRVRVCVYGCGFGGYSGQVLPGILTDLGSVAYARQKTGNQVIGSDFGIVEIPDSELVNVRASLPVWGGPTVATQGSGSGTVCHYGNGVFVAESFATMARSGYGLGTSAEGGWFAAVAINGGDSGSPIVQCNVEGTNGSGGFHGRAPLGIVTHGIGVADVGVPGYGAGTTVAKARAMALQAGIAIDLVTAS